jgi:hypothetical protein
VRYRIEHKSQWFASLKFAIAQASKVTHNQKPIRVVDERGKVVWSSSDEQPAVDVPPVPEPVEPQGDLF